MELVGGGSVINGAYPVYFFFLIRRINQKNYGLTFANVLGGEGFGGKAVQILGVAHEDGFLPPALKKQAVEPFSCGPPA